MVLGCGEPAAAPTAASASTPLSGPAARAALTLQFGGFSVTREVFGRRILPEFARTWLKSQGQELRFVERYDGSGLLTQALGNAFPADVMVFALAEDLDRVVASGLIQPLAAEQRRDSIVSRSLVVLAVRKGNPKAIHDWRDLTRPGVRVVTPDPATSGGGRWNVYALYGAALRGHAGVPAGDAAAALGFVRSVLANVIDRGVDAHQSFRAFQAGTGDVAITYECEVTGSWIFGHDEQRVIPSSTLLVENPAVVVDAYVDRHGTRAAAEALIAYLRAPEAQKRLAFHGLRPVDPAVAADHAAQFPTPDDLWTIADLGGFERAAREILTPLGFAPAPAGK